MFLCCWMGTSRPARKPMDIDAPSQGAIHAQSQATPCEMITVEIVPHLNIATKVRHAEPKNVLYNYDLSH